MNPAAPRGWPALILLASAVSGCGGHSPRPEATGRLGPHRGALLQLPGGTGFAEVVVESSGGRGKALTTEVAAYFLGPDAAGPLSPRPTGVALDIYLAEAKTTQTVPLKPSPKDGDPAGPGRFAATPPPGFDGTLMGGKLVANHEGRPIALRF